MMIYFHPKRFDPQFTDLVTVATLDTEVSTKGGGSVMPAKDLIARWMVNNPEGSVTITGEEKER